MLWLLLDAVIVLAALAVLAVLARGLYRQVKTLLQVVTAAGETITSATDAMSAASVDGRPGNGRLGDGRLSQPARPPGR